MAQIQYFLGGNTPAGFYSLYDQLTDPRKVNQLYILKGGAGCGKSTLMKQVAQQGQAAGLDAEYILCSGDPDSLDGILFPALSVAVADGTSPHVIEAQYAGAVERYADLSGFYDHAALQAKREEIITLTDTYRGHYKNAYRCLSAAEQLWREFREAACAEPIRQKLTRRAAGIIRREIKISRTGSGVLRRRFLTAVTHRGAVALWDTVSELADRVYRLSDSYGLAHHLLSPIAHAALAAGYDVISCPDPMEPESVAHLIIPELSLAFVSDSFLFPWPQKTYRHLRLDAMSEQSFSDSLRSRLRLSRKIYGALIDEAVSGLTRAKEAHDRLEEMYNPHVDFAGVGRLADQIAEEIFA